MRKKSFLHYLNGLIRASLFTAIVVLTLIPYSIICLIGFACPLRWRYSFIMTWNKLMLHSLKFLCHIDWKIEGLENIPKDHNGIILSKHQSMWETLLLPTIFPQPAIIVKRELMWVPLFGWGLAASEPISINRSNRASAMEQILTKGKKYLNEGRWILMFPEGTRIAPGQTGKYRAGGPKLAVESGFPIIPVAHNAGRFWSKRQFIKNPGTVKVVIGREINPKGKSVEEVLEEVQTWIEKTVKEIDKTS